MNIEGLEVQYHADRLVVTLSGPMLGWLGSLAANMPLTFFESVPVDILLPVTFDVPPPAPIDVTDLGTQDPNSSLFHEVAVGVLGVRVVPCE